MEFNITNVSCKSSVCMCKKNVQLSSYVPTLTQECIYGEIVYHNLIYISDNLWIVSLYASFRALCVHIYNIFPPCKEIIKRRPLSMLYSLSYSDMGLV